MLKINCPHCFSTNQLPDERLKDKPKCGKCKKPLFTGSPVELTPGNVAATLNHNSIPVLVDCWASWCGPCRQFAPIFEQAARELEPNIRFAKLNTEAVPSISQRWQIRSIPTLILFKNGKEFKRESGVMPLAQLKSWLKRSGAL